MARLRPVAVYMWLVVAAAGGMIALTWRIAGGDAWAGADSLGVAASLFVLSLVALRFPLQVRPGLKVTVAAAVNFAGLLLLGLPAALMLAGGSRIVGGLAWRLRGRRKGRLAVLREIAFNAGQVVVAYGLGGLVYLALVPGSGGLPMDRVENLWAVPAAAATVFLANTLLVAAAAALEKRKGLVEAWLPGRGVDALQSAGLYATGLVAALAGAHYPWALLVMVLPAGMIYLSMKRTVELAVQAQAMLETMKQLAEQREELAKRMAEAAALHELDRTKNELITTISHELRTPITVIHGYAQLLKARGGTLEAGRMEALAQAVYANSTQLQRLVQDLVDVGRVERGTFTLEVETFDLAETLRDVVAGLQARDGGERVAYEGESELRVLADRARVVQVASNLVENALKYAPEGPIHIRARHEGTAVRIEVEDQGSGVPPEEQQRVWEKFYRGAEVVRHNLQRGTGIGLALVKALVDAQGGRVGLESGTEGGALFWFELPAAESAAVRTQRQPAALRAA